MPPTAYLVRHCATGFEDCFEGWENPPLTESGMDAALQIANYLSYERVGRMVSSDLALQTAQIITEQTPSQDFSLRPWNVAGFGGKEKTPELEERLEYYRLRPDLKIPDGESYADFGVRMAILLEYIKAGAVIVTHKSNLLYLGLDLEPGGVAAVYPDGEKMTFQPRLGEKVRLDATPQETIAGNYVTGSGTGIR